MASYYDGKVAIVTGAASGIGAALTRALTQQGTELVVLADIDEAGATKLADEITAGRAGRVEAAPLDVRDGPAFAALANDVIRRHGRVDLLFNNAGVGVGGDVEDVTAAHWARVVDVNIWGVVHGVRAVYPHMIERGSGHIVNTASLSGLAPTPLVTPYCMTKHAIVGLSTSLRVEARDKGVRVTALCPGAIDTPLLDRRGPEDLPAPPLELNPRRYLRRLLGKECDVDRFASKALAGVARNRALVIAPTRARVLLWGLRLAPRPASERIMLHAVRAERAAVQADTNAGG